MFIRTETAADVLAIRSLTARAFAGLPYSDGSEPRIIDKLRSSGALTISLVAEERGEIVGHVAVSPVTIENGASDWFGLGPISVEPVCQRRGIGATLMRAALETLHRMHAAGCVVLGEPAYYTRFGFSQVHRLSYPGPPADYFMAIQFAQATAEGMVKYHAAFENQE